MSILNSWKKTYKISLPDEAQIRETITSDFMKSIGLFLENHARQESLLNSRSLNLPSHVDQEVKRLHTQQSCYYYKLKHINHFFAYTPNRHQYAVNYYYNQADENETHFRFVYSHDGNTAFPNNTPAAREKAKAIKLTTPFEAAKYKKLHQLKHNCKKMGLEFLANIGIQTPELSKNNVYDLSECFFVNSQYDFHSPFIIDTPTLPLPIWKKQNPYQMAILEKLYPQLIKLQKKVDREKYIILSLKNAIKTRIAEQFSLSRENTFSNQKLNYDSARFKIVEDVEDSEIPANTLRGGLNLLIEEIVPFEILRAILNQLVAKSIPKEAKVRIKHFLDLLTAKYQNQNVGRSNHIFSQEELYQTLDECIPDPILDDVKIHLKEYHELSSLYLDISDNLRYNQNQNLTHFQNELPENNPLKKELSKLSKKENKFYTHFNDLKKNVEKIQPYYPQVYKDSCELIRHIQQLHTSHSGIHNRLIKVIKSTNTLIKVLGQNPKRPEAKLAITNYKKLANSISSSSKLKLIGGIMLTLVGAVTLAAGVTSTLLSVGLFAPTGIIISAAGGCALAAGIGLLASEANIHSFFSPQARGKYHLAKQMRQTLKDAKNICHETSFSHGACA